MIQLISKYLIIVIVQIAVFSHFIACGSDVYKKSLENDHDSEPLYTIDSPYYGIHAIKGWASLPVPFKIESRMTARQEALILQAVAIWEEAIGMPVFDYQGRISGHVGDDFFTLRESLDDNINGNYFNVDWEQKTGKDSLVLATAVWKKNHLNQILSADIRYNIFKYFLTDGDDPQQESGDNRDIVDLVSLALHELGHKLGLDHVSVDIDQYSIMNPTLYIGAGMTARTLSDGDRHRIRLIYDEDYSLNLTSSANLP